MSAKIITSLSDENQNLQKQMGCMNRIFQLFDHHHFLTGRSNKKQLPGSNQNVELACAKETAPHLQQQNLEIGNVKPSQAMPSKHQDGPIPLGRQSPELRGIVEDVMHREARGVSIKMVGKEENKNYVMKYIDSPRPLHNPKSWKPNVAGAAVSTQSLAKYREAPRIAKEEMDTSVQRRLKDPPRFSYDSRELRETTRSGVKLKELPRLSLDSRDTRDRHASDSRPIRERGVYSLTHEPSSNKRSTVIAMLMGLEPFPDHPVTNQSKTTTSERDSISRSSLSVDLNLPYNIPLSPRFQKDPISPGPSKTKFGKKTTENLRLPLEQMPWRQQNAYQEPHNLAGKNTEDPDKRSHSSSTIYGQMKKRTTDLRFKESGEDLRALKKILEAMQKTRIRLENQQEVDLKSQTSGCFLEYEGNNPAVTTIKRSGPQKPQKLVDKSLPHISTVAFSQFRKVHVHYGKFKGVHSEHKPIGRDQRPVRSNPQQPGWQSPQEENMIKGRLLNTPQLSKETRHKKEQNFTVPGKSSGTMSPQTIQKQQYVLEKKKQNNRPSSDLNNARAQSSAPNRNPKVKPSYLQGEDRKYKQQRAMRDRLHKDDAASLLSESNNSSASQMEPDFTSTHSYENGCNRQGGYKNRDLALRLRNNTPTGELVIPTTEQPSPISVLDASFYREDSPSPVKKIATPFTDDSLGTDQAEWSPEILDHLQETRMPNRSVELYNKNMEDIRSLVHKLDKLNKVTHEATTYQIEPLSDKTKPDNHYITRILLASGLLEDISSLSIPIQLHSNDHALNPKLFHVLEQTEEQNDFSAKSTLLKVDRKIQRKIVFDTVNEILAQKLGSERSNPPGLRTGSVIELMKEVHCEVERLQKLSYSSNDVDEDHDQVLSIFGSDMANQSEGWKDYEGEILSLVLDIERQIFKDLITEAINDKITGKQNVPKHSKKLFNI